MSRLAITILALVFGILLFNTGVNSLKSTNDEIYNSKLEAAYSMGYWRGFRMTLKNYPPADKKIKLSPMVNDKKSYSEVQKELDETKN